MVHARYRTHTRKNQIEHGRPDRTTCTKKQKKDQYQKLGPAQPTVPDPHLFFTGQTRIDIVCRFAQATVLLSRRVPLLPLSMELNDTASQATVAGCLAPSPVVPRPPTAVPTLASMPAAAHSETWVLPTTIVGAIACAAVFSAALLYCFKRRRFRDARAADPRLSWTRFKRRLNMNPAQKQAEDDSERRMLLHRALADRQL